MVSISQLTVSLTKFFKRLGKSKSVGKIESSKDDGLGANIVGKRERSQMSANLEYYCHPKDAEQHLARIKNNPIGEFHYVDLTPYCTPLQLQLFATLDKRIREEIG